MYRDKLARAGVIEELFADFDDYLGSRGYKAMGGQIIDASIVSVRKQRNTRDENEKIKRGEVPGEWKKEKRAHKDTDASVHDSRVFEEMLDEGNGGEGVWADSAYRSKEREKTLRERGYRICVNRKGSRNKPPGRWEKYANRIYSGVRVRVEHVFGAQSDDMGGRLLRSIGDNTGQGAHRS